jgi:hypothetical protein
MGQWRRIKKYGSIRQLKWSRILKMYENMLLIIQSEIFKIFDKDFFYIHIEANDRFFFTKKYNLNSVQYNSFVKKSFLFACWIRERMF